MRARHWSCARIAETGVCQWATSGPANAASAELKSNQKRDLEHCTTRSLNWTDNGSSGATNS